MPTVYDVPANVLIGKLVEYLKRVPQLSPPAWTSLAKTGSHSERIPQERDWLYIRYASLLRKIYLHGPIGLSDLEAKYGDRKRFGHSLAHHRDAGGSIIRKALQQLEAAGLVTKKEKEGRILTSRGVSLLDRLSSQIFKDQAKTESALARYT